MRQHELRAPHGARKARRRVGRGISSGQGKTAGKGTKGQLARSGPGIPGWFEGGQTPIHMRIPKMRGFKNTRFRISYVGVNVVMAAMKALSGLRSAQRIREMRGVEIGRRREPEPEAVAP